MKLFYLVKKELIEITRQKELLFLMFVGPVIQIIILGYVISTDIRHVPVGIVNLSRGQAAARIIERVRRSPLFDVRLESSRSEDYIYPLKKGEVKAMLIFRDALDEQAQRPEISRGADPHGRHRFQHLDDRRRLLQRHHQELHPQRHGKAGPGAAAGRPARLPLQPAAAQHQLHGAGDRRLPADHHHHVPDLGLAGPGKGAADPGHPAHLAA